MSGIDEQEPKEERLCCPACEGTVFEMVHYGYRKDRATIDEDTNEISIYEDDWYGDDYEPWRCLRCYCVVPDHIKELLEEKMAESW